MRSSNSLWDLKVLLLNGNEPATHFGCGVHRRLTHTPHLKSGSHTDSPTADALFSQLPRSLRLSVWLSKQLIKKS